MNYKPLHGKIGKSACRSNLAILSVAQTPKLFTSLLLITLCGLSTVTNAVAATEPQQSPALPAAKQTESTAVNARPDHDSLTAATVRKIDIAQAKITLKHAAIANIGMPAMTMVFKVADPALFTGLQVNDTVLFSVEKQGAALVVTEIKRQNPTNVE